jgi:3-oxoadipate enol-lactonase
LTTARVNGQDLYYTDTGSAGDGRPAVVFSHGPLLDSSMWQPQIEELMASHRCIAWDRRLHGRTRDDGVPHSHWDSAADLLRLLDHLGIEEAALAGHSQGGFVALRAALLAPKRVSALVLSSTMAFAWPQGVAGWLISLRDGFRMTGPGAVAAPLLSRLIGREDLYPTWLARWKAQSSARLADAVTGLLPADDISRVVGDIGVPALVIHGGDDSIVPIEAGRALHAALPGVTGMLVVPGAAHSPTLTHPDPTTNAIVKFLLSR